MCQACSLIFPRPAQERWNCTVAEECTWDNNKGWRLVMFTSSRLSATWRTLRIFVVRLKETPKYLIGKGRDEDLVKTLQEIATRYNRPCDLTVEQLAAIGEVRVKPTTGKQVLRDHGQHSRDSSRRRSLVLSTAMVWLSWTLIGLAYPMFYVFLPYVNTILGPPCHPVSRNQFANAQPQYHHLQPSP